MPLSQKTLPTSPVLRELLDQHRGHQTRTQPPAPPARLPGHAGPALTWLRPRRGGSWQGSPRRGRRGAAPARGGPIRTAGPALRDKSKHRLRHRLGLPHPMPARTGPSGPPRAAGGGGEAAAGAAPAGPSARPPHLATGSRRWAPPFCRPALVHRRNRSRGTRSPRPRRSVPAARGPGHFSGVPPSIVPPARHARACRSAGARVPAPARCPGRGDPWPGAG